MGRFFSESQQPPASRLETPRYASPIAGRSWRPLHISIAKFRDSEPAQPARLPREKSQRQLSPTKSFGGRKLETRMDERVMELSRTRRRPRRKNSPHFPRHSS